MALASLHALLAFRFKFMAYLYTSVSLDGLDGRSNATSLTSLYEILD